MYDLIIIGGGPAGITAGIYSGRQKLSTLLITKEIGGQLMKKAGMIENYPGFKEIPALELIQKFHDHLKKIVTEKLIKLRLDEVVKVKKEKEIFLIFTKKQERFQSKALIVAVGTIPRKLNVPGEREYIGKGVSYCVTCDGPLFKDKTVAIIGGGNSALEAALFLSKIAKKIYILEARERLGGDRENQERVRKLPNVTILLNVIVKEIRGEKFVNCLLYQEKNTKKEIPLSIDGIFVEIGGTPETSFLGDLVERNERKEIIVDFETYQTKTPGLFAVGDVNTGKYKQIVIACGEGAKSALFANEYLQRLKKDI